MVRFFVATFVLLPALALSTFAQGRGTQIWYEKGLAAAGKGEFTVALKDFETSRKVADVEGVSSGYAAKVRFNIGVCLYRLERSREALRELSAAIVLAGGSYEKASYALGMAEVDLKNMQAAQKAFRETLKSNPKNGEAWFDLALIYLNDNDMESALVAFQRAIENGTVASAVSHNNIGVALLLKDDFAGAEKEFEAALVESGGTLTQAKLNLEFSRARNRSAARFVAMIKRPNEDLANQ